MQNEGAKLFLLEGETGPLSKAEPEDNAGDPRHSVDGIAVVCSSSRPGGSPSGPRFAVRTRCLPLIVLAFLSGAYLQVHEVEGHGRMQDGSSHAPGPLWSPPLVFGKTLPSIYSRQTPCFSGEPFPGALWSGEQLILRGRSLGTPEAPVGYP